MAVACSSTRHLTMILVMVCIVTVCKQIDAKRGCSFFGHSCHGGHGKRSGGALNGAPLSLRTMGLLGARDVAMALPVYPPTISDIPSFDGDDIIPARNGGFSHNREGQQLLGRVNPMKNHISPFLKQWLIEFRKAQQQSN